ncbi:hypothetical protein ABPG72_009161 [Tetrahymena utriculariae]
MNNPTRVYPAANLQQQATAGNSPQIRYDTPKLNNKGDNINNNINNNTPKNINVQGTMTQNMNAAGVLPMGTIQKREDLLIDTNTNQNNLGNTNMQLSPTSNKSYLKINGYNLIEQLKKNFVTAIDNISNSRLVETLGGLATIDEKKQAIIQFSILWKNLLDILNNIQESICLMTFENDIPYPNKEKFISELIIENIKDIENQYLELIQSSSLRFLDTVCTVHDLQYKHLINIRYDIRTWRKTNLDHIKETQPTNRKYNSLNGSYDKDGLYNGSRNKSMFASICGCCLSNDVKNSSSINARQQSQIKR